MKKTLVSLLLVTAMVLPGISHASTLSPERISQIKQLIALIEELIASATIVDDSTVATSTAPVASLPIFTGITNSPITISPMALQVKAEVGGCLYPEIAKQFNLNAGDFKDAKQCDAGVVYFTVEQDFDSAMLTYYPSDLSASEIAQGIKSPNGPDTEVVRNGNLIHPNETTFVNGFASGKSYHWIIDVTKDGQVERAEGDVTIPKYKYSN